MGELTKRVLFAIPAAVLALWITSSGGIYFYAALILLALSIQFEMQGIVEKAGFKPARFFSYIIACWILLSPVLPYAFEIGIALFLVFISIQVLNTRETHIQELVATFFCAGYASFGLLFLWLIRNAGPDQTGFLLTITLFLMIWGNDVFAYFGGKYFGRHRLAPDISPSKTWEGLFFGFLGSVIGLVIVFLIVPLQMPVEWPIMLPAALIVSIFSPLGDLAESKLKRAAEVKDASSLLPGHGGFMDRFDGMILAAPAFFLYIHCLQLAGYVSF